MWDMFDRGGPDAANAKSVAEARRRREQSPENHHRLALCRRR